MRLQIGVDLEVKYGCFFAGAMVGKFDKVACAGDVGFFAFPKFVEH